MSTSTQTLRPGQIHNPKSAPGKPPTSGGDKRLVQIKFLEGSTAEFSTDQLQEHDITRYQVTKFYEQQIRNSGYYDQLKYIVEPSMREFESPGQLDTSGEHDSTVVPGLQHKYLRLAYCL
jgi:lysine 2,3-aminomutase